MDAQAAQTYDRIVYPWDRPDGERVVPAPGDTIEVAPGVHWLRMPLPFALDHINLWLLDDGDGWTIVDTGYGVAATRKLWRRLFETRLGGRPVTRVIATHFHPDHMGSAAWLAGHWRAPFWTTQGEWLMAHLVHAGRGPTNPAARAAFYREHGLDDERLATMKGRGNTYRKGVPDLPGEYRRLRDGDAVEIGGHAWRIIVGTGHAPEHACLFADGLGVLISGDQILPRITTNVSVWPGEPLADPLADYIGSLDRFRPLPAGTLVLPSHDRPFTGLHARLDMLASHHDDRLAELAGMLDGAPSAAALMPRLFRRPLDAHQTMFAMGETIAHLHYLIGRGEVARERDGDEVWRFSRRR